MPSLYTYISGLWGVSNACFELYLGDCLEIMKTVPDDSIDMIACDLPYGVTQNRLDVVIPFEPLWREYERVIKERGCIALFAQGDKEHALRK